MMTISFIFAIFGIAVLLAFGIVIGIFIAKWFLDWRDGHVGESIRFFAEGSRRLEEKIDQLEVKLLEETKKSNENIQKKLQQLQNLEYINNDLRKLVEDYDDFVAKLDPAIERTNAASERVLAELDKFGRTSEQSEQLRLAGDSTTDAPPAAGDTKKKKRNGN